ncbi:hypothetical protein NLU13_2457 [Sarocladium strictum]|uniref:Zn(2)-C6 fungal-type domain-containing protein n=1 Tax=Sarocladium strictum TaxID=5046 RepID=A0AA39GSV1_SARSR|nr:hypothetical protein NLU13_2457 [Sarocladium strictum]
MVGVPRSSGCRLCVQRRVKCDQSKPWCQNCARYGAPCPGYNHGYKFVSNKHHIRPRQRRGHVVQQPGSKPTSPRPSTPYGRELARSPSPTVAAHGRSRLPIPLREPRASYINQMLETLHAGLGADELAFLHPWFKGMQQHIGTKVTLDSAVMSLVLQMLGKRSRDSRLIGESHFLYGRSLHALQLALNSTAEWQTTETLCTTVLLCHFEMFAGTGDALSWMKHADALGLLIERRGPDAYANECDLNVFNTCRTAIIFNCFWSGKDCFFAEPPWERVLRRGDNTQGLTQSEAQRRALVNDYVVILARLPGIMRRVYPLFQARSQGFLLPAYAEGLSAMRHTISDVYQSLIRWSERLHSNMPPPVEIATSDETSPWATVLSYENVWFGALYMGYWTVRLLLQLGLELTRNRDETFEDDRLLLSNVLRSCETVGEGIMGPYRIGFSIRCAYDLADPPTRVWIKSKLSRFQETSASIDANLFVSPDERTAS